MKKIYQVALGREEEAELQALISRGKTSARKVTRARILLLAHAGAKDSVVARALQTSVSTVERTRRNLVLEGLRAALEEAPRPGAKPKLDARGRGHLVALACRTPPLGREGWTLELLADKLVALGHVESFSREAVRRALKKTSASPGAINSGASPRRARSSSGAWRT